MERGDELPHDRRQGVEGIYPAFADVLGSQEVFPLLRAVFPPLPIQSDPVTTDLENKVSVITGSVIARSDCTCTLP